MLISALLVAGQASPVLAAAAPTVTSVSPSGGPLKGGQNVVIKGTDFTGATAVKFGSVNATSFAVMSATKIVAEVPDASAAASELITVTTSDGTNSTGASYKYGAPTVKSVSPAFANPATASIITITGSGFLGTTASEVKFGTFAAAQVWVVSDTQIVAKTPIDDSSASPAVVIPNGVTDVTVTRNSVVSATGTGSTFLFTPGIPTITNLGASPAVTGTDGAAVGTLMTVTGTRLWGVTKVSFGNKSVTATADIVVASNGNTLTVKVPANSSGGPVVVTVKNGAGTSLTNLNTRFSYYSSVAPKITSVSPDVFDKASSGGGGTFLVVGKGFTGVTASKVTLKCTSDVTPTSAIAVSDTSLIVVIPGNGGTAEACGLEIVNPLDSTKTTTKATAVRYV